MTSPSAPAAPFNAAFEQQVKTALLDMAYRRLRMSMSMSMLLTVVVCLVFGGLIWPYFPNGGMGWWMAVLLLTVVARYGFWWAHSRVARPALQHQRWQWLFGLSALLGGASWALGPVMMMPAAGRTESLLLVLTVLSVSAVSVTAMASHKFALLAFQLATLLPTMAALFATGGDVERMASAVLLAAMLCLTVVGWASSSATRALVETELRLSQSVEATNLARERAEAASLAKTRFLANMSHELRTPLNAVIGAAQLMRADDRDAEQRAQLVDAIQRSGTNLLGLIENILDLSRIEAGEMKLVAHDFHLVDCLEAALATAGLAARAKGLQLACIVAPDLPAWRHADGNRLRQVLLNLLGNAVKFTVQGEIVVRVERGPGLEDVRISVTDTGIGIGAASLGHVFEPFRQGDDGAQRRFGGSGLGLAIVRQLVEAMDGHIGVQSTLGQGSSFELVLPLPPAHECADEPPAQNHRVAYFEPHASSAEALQAQLTRLGCQVQRCRDASELRVWCAQSDPALPHPWLLVCTDTPEAAEVLSQTVGLLDPEWVVGLSSLESADATMALQPLNLPRRIIKPVLRAALASRLVAASAVSAAAVSRHVPSSKSVLPSSSAASRAMTHVLVVEDDPLNQTIVCRLLNHAGYGVSAANDGQSALAALREMSYDIVLMDWQMPDMDGLEVTRRVRAGEAGAATSLVPIVALTANAFSEDRDACLNAGMNDFLTKPVLANHLRAAIERWARPAVPAAARPQEMTATFAAGRSGSPQAVFEAAVLPLV